MTPNVLREKVRAALLEAYYVRGMKRHRLYIIMERLFLACYSFVAVRHLTPHFKPMQTRHISRPDTDGIGVIGC